MKTEQPQRSSHCRLTLWVSLLVIVASSLSVQAQSDLCIKHTDFVTGDPTIDGIVFAVDTPIRPPDVGWTNAARYS